MTHLPTSLLVHWVGRFCDARQEWRGRTQVWNYNGSSNTKQLYQLCKSVRWPWGVCGLDQCSCHSTHSRLPVVLLQVLIRRLKKDVLTQLPPKIRQRVPLNVGTADLRKAQKTMKQLDERRNMGEILASDDPEEALAARNEDRNEFMEAYREIGECTGLLVVSATSGYGTGRS